MFVEIKIFSPSAMQALLEQHLPEMEIGVNTMFEEH